MNRRTFRVLNFFAFNLLFFALYLLFIHKESDIVPLIPSSEVVTAGSSQATIVDNPEQYTKKDVAQASHAKEEKAHN